MSTWMITGASGGFGRLMTEKLLERGDVVIGTVRRPEALDDLLAKYGPDQLHVLRMDLADADSVRAGTNRAFAEAGRIDVVVSNAGHGTFGAAEELTDAQIRRVIDVNLLGSIALIRAALPHLRAQGGGRFLQVASEGGQIAYPNFNAYHASKWGIEGFIESTAQEVRPFGIDFTILEPGPSRTGFGAALDTCPGFRGLRPNPIRTCGACWTGMGSPMWIRTEQWTPSSQLRTSLPRRFGWLSVLGRSTRSRPPSNRVWPSWRHSAR